MRRLAPLLCAAVVCAWAAPAALAAPANQAVADCNSHGRLTHTYTAAQLRTALTTMPADIKEYTDCYDVIQRQLLTELGTGNSSGAGVPASSSGGSSFPTALVVVIAVLVVAAGAFAGLALRRRR
jgi:hypothetical protein